MSTMLFSILGEREKYNEAFALVTIIGSNGTVSRHSGRMAVFPDGTTCGTIGGGAHEAEAVSLALSALKEGRGRREILKVREFGEIEIMIDVPIKDRRVLIVGAGHIGKAVYDVFYYLGWHVTVVDTRSLLLNEESYPYAERILSETLREGVQKVSINASTAIVNTIPEELDNIKDIFDASPAFYIGLLSSRKRKVPSARRYHLPMGIDIGEETPEEIALSTAAQILGAFNKRNCMPYSDEKKKLVVVRGAGDLATGCIVALKRAGYMVIATETDKPTVIRRTVSFAEGIYTGAMTIEGVRSTLCSSPSECLETVRKGEVALMVDRDGLVIKELQPAALVDAILAKKNMGTTIDMAPFVVALGPGFTCGIDCNCVIETMRGHNLARALYSGHALPNTGVPGIIAGHGKERVMHTPCSGTFRENAKIGDIVKKGDIIGYVDDEPLYASIDGKIRGLLHSGLVVPEHFKAADIDPRGEEVDHTTISDKSRAIGNSVVVAIDSFLSTYN